VKVLPYVLAIFTDQALLPSLCVVFEYRSNGLAPIDENKIKPLDRVNIDHPKALRFPVTPGKDLTDPLVLVIRVIIPGGRGQGNELRRGSSDE